MLDMRRWWWRKMAYMAILRWVMGDGAVARRILSGAVLLERTVFEGYFQPPVLFYNVYWGGGMICLLRGIKAHCGDPTPGVSAKILSDHLQGLFRIAY
jgi:hypothetical protein